MMKIELLALEFQFVWAGAAHLQPNLIRDSDSCQHDGFVPDTLEEASSVTSTGT